eukprot:gene7728-7927_t
MAAQRVVPCLCAAAVAYQGAAGGWYFKATLKIRYYDGPMKYLFQGFFAWGLLIHVSTTAAPADVKGANRDRASQPKSWMYLNLVTMLKVVLGDEGVQQVGRAAAAAGGHAVAGGAYAHYAGFCSATPVSIKALQVMQYTSPSAGLKESSTATSNQQEASSAPATAALDPSRATLIESTSPAARFTELPAVAVMVGDAVVASKQTKAFGVPVLRPSAGAAPPGADHSKPGVVLEGCCWPACLIANKEQQVELLVEQLQQQCNGQQMPAGCGRVMGAAQGVPGWGAAENDEVPGRLIVFGDAGVLLDAPVAVGRVISQFPKGTAVPARVSSAEVAPPAAASESAVHQVPQDVTSALQHVLTYLAECGLFATMGLLVEAAASAACGEAAMAESPSRVPQSSSNTEALGRAIAPTVDDSLSDNGSCHGCSSRALRNGGASKAGIGSSNGHTHLAAAESACVGDRFAGVRVPSSHLLWGFTAPGLEAAYQAAAFSNTAVTDLVLLVYSTCFGIACYVHSYPLLVLGLIGSRGSMQSAAAALLKVCSSSEGLFLLWSHALVLLVSVLGPLPVVLLRRKLIKKLQCPKREGHQQLQLSSQQSPHKANPDLPAAGSSCRITSVPGLRWSSSQEQQQADQHLMPPSSAGTLPCSSRGNVMAEQLLASAGVAKQQLLSVWMLAVVLWGMLVLFGAGRLVAEPPLITRAWANSSGQASLGCLVGLAIKGWTAGQVRFNWFLPVITAETALNMAGSIIFSSHKPHPWLAGRYLVGYLLAVAASAVQHVQGRAQFAARRNVVVL